MASTDLHDAALDGDEPEVERLIAAHPEYLKVADEDGHVPLHLAAYGGHRGVTRLLCNAYKAGAAAKNSTGRVPLHYAAAGRCTLRCTLRL